MKFRKKELIPLSVKVRISGVMLISACIYLIIKNRYSSLCTTGLVVGFLLLITPNIIKWKKSCQKKARYKKYLKSSLKQIDQMEGEEFEKWAEAYFANLGYEVDLTPASNDYGADLIAWNKDESIAVQCKRYSGKVGIAAVQQIIGAVGYYHVTRGMVITNSFFTTQARTLAESVDVELIDRNDLLEM